MPNLIEREYAQTGQSTSTNAMGMREMQERAFEARNSKYLLIKAPPAAGKSRALMFIALDKLFNQGLKKVIVAVPERSIARSFATTNLTDHGFFADWEVPEENNLCTPGSPESKVDSVVKFLEAPDPVMVCTHATLRFAHDAVGDSSFDQTLVAVDEFHHVSAQQDSRLGSVVRSLMGNTEAHILAMTGSYFRGDGDPILEPEDEARFDRITYNYYDQLDGYTYLKSLGIGYHFYQGKYTDAIGEILDTDEKTLLHIPHIHSGESTKDKNREVDEIIDSFGVFERQDDDTGVIYVKRNSDGKIIKVADLVNDDPKDRDKIVAYLQTMDSVDDMDLIIALGMAKEGFDWPFCEHALTVGYRGSLTEVIQIIGRCTRDSENKSHAQFTNLIAQPDAGDLEVTVAVNNMLKAITASLLMEQVLTPNFNFKAKKPGVKAGLGDLVIDGFKEPSTPRVKAILDSDLNDLKAKVMQNQQMLKAMPGNVDPEVMNTVLIPRIIRKEYPDLSEDEVEEVRQTVVTDSVVKNGKVKEVGDRRFILMAGKFVKVEDLKIDLIDSVNPFQEAFEILSKSVTTQVLAVIQEAIDATRIDMTWDEARILWPKIQAFVQVNGREPKIRATDPLEVRMAEVLIYLRKERNERGI